MKLTWGPPDRRPAGPARPWLLDLFCGAGGAAMGYWRAGFDILGVDSRPMPRYPFRFVRADALETLASWDLSRFAAIHASPPCQAYSATRTMWSNPGGHPELIEPVRELLRQSGRPWIIENVAGAPLGNHVLLCGSMFGLLLGEQWELRRHRLFELGGWWCLQPQCQHDPSRRALGVYGNGGANTKAHNRKGTTALIGQAREIMGIDWMTTAEISQAIPPAYTEFIGRQLIDTI